MVVVLVVIAVVVTVNLPELLLASEKDLEPNPWQ